MQLKQNFVKSDEKDVEKLKKETVVNPKLDGLKMFLSNKAKNEEK